MEGNDMVTILGAFLLYVISSYVIGYFVAKRLYQKHLLVDADDVTDFLTWAPLSAWIGLAVLISDKFKDFITPNVDNWKRD
jgi:prolipoprotein diacylglyceryltransferase